MPDAARIDLSKYRLERAGEMLKTARRDLEAGDYASANNRAYYCVFHAMRATLALTGEDYKKHSGVISRFSYCFSIKHCVLWKRHRAKARCPFCAGWHKTRLIRSSTRLWRYKTLSQRFIEDQYQSSI